MKKRPFFRMVSTLAAIWVLAQSGGVLAYSVRQSTIESEDDSRLTSLHQLMEKQAFSTAADREKAMEGAEYLLFDSAYAAVEGGTFPYPNSGGYVMNVDDGIYQVKVKAAGCYAYSKYASYVSYGEFGEKCWLRDGGGREITHTDELTGEILRDFLLRYGQMGEHLRLDGVHSVTFLAGDEEGFYFTEYSSDNDPFIRLRYVTYEDFAASAQKENTAIWFLDSNPMENDEDSGNILPQPEEAQDIQVLVYLNPSYSHQVELTVKSGEAVGALPVPEGVEGAVFAGWYTHAISGERVTEATVFQGISSVVLYPRYQPVAAGERHTVTLQNQQDGSNLGICQAVNGDVWNLPEPVMQGYVFAGWYDGEGRLYRNGDTIALSGDMVLYAAFEKSAAQTTITLQIGNPLMTINGVEQMIDPQGTVPVLRQDRTLLPVRAVMEGLGGTVEWDGANQAVSLTRGEQTLFLRIGSTVAWDKDGARFILDSEPILLNDRTMLPIRFVVEYFGGTVEWVGETQTVEIVG